ncbi:MULTISPECIES: hypothetical protein [unclassified Roseateles]|uniref:hypothetical protein n=1 Tax=unclassified Roseateles TaxID=2626991 RepID=UPI0006FB74D3|nr:MULTISPECIES: hypothetical protein [unclassified Roseateles]KQW46526.1 hypothetical protein ASC81_08990 [Pelomonas sp. Root405]KRA73577.1 hypothetical protein ASD88_08990 [Pelomonas sp. Root662]
MNQDDLWWQTLADGPLLLALFDADDRLLRANPAYRAAWQLADDATPAWSEMVEAALLAGVGPVEAPERRSRMAQRGYEQAWRDGRRLWWVEQRMPAGGLALTGVDISALARPRPLSGQLLATQAGTELLQALLADPRAWPLSIATLPADADPAELLTRIRGEDGCLRLQDGRLLVMLPSTGPAQAAALGGRLGATGLTEAVWGESAAALLARV